MKFPFLLLMYLCSVSFVKAQTPGGINYQGVARNQFLVGLNNDSIALRFTIRERTINGTAIYTETRKTNTDSFGVFNVVIGAAGAVSQSGDIKLVKWSDTTKKFLQVEMNIYDPNTPGFLNMGTTQLLSVPFAFYSDISDSTRIAAKADSSKYAASSGKYFFSATIPPDYFQNIPNGALYTVKIPRVLQNEGNVYDSVNSIFTAPDTGIYHFDITAAHLLDENPIGNINALWSEDAQVALVKNGAFVKLLHEEFHSNNPQVINSDKDRGVSYFNTGLTLRLNKNDQISIQIRVNYVNFSSYRLGYFSSGLDSTLYAEFSGYKIK